MNKSAIKGFSIRARRKLIEDITQKAYSLGILDTGKYEEIEEFEGGFKVKNTTNQIVYSKELKSHRDKLITEVNKKGFEQVIEEVAYTWFNRIIAIRFMEINEYLPVKVRILSSDIEGKTEPDVLTDIYNYVEELNLDSDNVFNLKEAHKYEELFKYIFVKECNNLGQLMPQVFEKIGDFTELLLPDQLLSSGSIIRDLIDSIEEENFKEEVEIIGWMYQYYISEKKDEVFAALKKNKKITKENIPAATQLFTPKWIVKYMTENSLGCLWQESHPDEKLKKNWEYYIEPAEQEVEVQKKLDELKNPNLSPEDITILDPAMGSGHILVYAFDVLFDIYISRGYSERDIPKLILEKNLYGLDIDDRAAQLATFALLMKARSKNRRFFKEQVELNICSIQESNGFSKEALEYLVNPNETQIEKIIHLEDAKYLIDVFKDAKEYGSILEVKPIDFRSIKVRVEEIVSGSNLNIFEYGYRNEIVSYILDLTKQLEIMTKRYDILITNPPYMGYKGMNSKLSNYVKKLYPNTKFDIFAVFMDLDKRFVKESGFVSMINQHSWMFLSSYEKYRKYMINNFYITSMLHLGARTFEDISGEVVQSTAYVSRFKYIDNYKGNYFRLINYKSSYEKERMFRIENSKLEGWNDKYISKCENYSILPGNKFGYWLKDNVLDLFKNDSIDLVGYIGKGLDACNQQRFERYWYEVEYSKIAIGNKEQFSDKVKWYPFSKGGGYRRWYGNKLSVVLWENNGFEIRNYRNSDGSQKSRPQNIDLYFKKLITWSSIGSNHFGARVIENLIYGNGSAMHLSEMKYFYFIMGLLNSKVSNMMLKFLSPTLSYNAGDLKKIPLKTCTGDFSYVNELVIENINISKDDWDESELSWDFTKHSLLSYNIRYPLISDAIIIWGKDLLKRYQLLESNEEKLNKYFINLYDLNGEISPRLDNNEISLKIVGEKNAIREYISFFIGCCFERYSIGANTNDIENIFVEDNILLISEEDYFKNDIVHRFVEFVKVTFSEETLEENLKYIAEVLNPKAKGTARQTIRTYFVKDFYKDHLKTYKKRPIYWMIDSGKKNGIKALFYLHRYDESTIARFRTEYLHKMQSYYENDIELTSNSIDAKDKKRVDKLKKKLIEITDFEKLVAHIANKQIKIDLDDGVEHNYELFQGIGVPQSDGQKMVKANLLAKRK